MRKAMRRTIVERETCEMSVRVDSARIPMMIARLAASFISVDATSDALIPMIGDAAGADAPSSPTPFELALVGEYPGSPITGIFAGLSPAAWDMACLSLSAG